MVVEWRKISSLYREKLLQANGGRVREKPWSTKSLGESHIGGKKDNQLDAPRLDSQDVNISLSINLLLQK